MKGNKCSHIFHSQCCQEWLRRQNQCPYCRVEMVEASEFREAAIEVLGRKRVEAAENKNMAMVAAPISTRHMDQAMSE